jgi:nucleoside triphosphate pyrophosphatase
MHLILASASPRRAELLTSAGFAFTVLPADVDETPRPDEEPAAYALRVAREKAGAVSEHFRKSGTVVLAADTVVVAAGRLLGKPADRADAAAMLRILSGITHDVLTGVVVKAADHEWVEVAATQVRFLPLSQREIDWYLSTGEADGKAGAYGIQGRAARFVERIEGSWSNVVGLPIATVYRLLTSAGALPADEAPPPGEALGAVVADGSIDAHPSQKK